MEYHKSKSGLSERKVGGIPPVVVMPNASSEGPEQVTGPWRGRTTWCIQRDRTLGCQSSQPADRSSPSVEAKQ